MVLARTQEDIILEGIYYAKAKGLCRHEFYYARRMMEEYMMNMFAGENPLRDAMMAEDKDPELVGRLATERGCHYIVVSQFEDFAEDPWNYEEFMNIDGYKIYRYVEPGPNMWPLQD